MFCHLLVQVQFLQGRWRLQLLHSILAAWRDLAAAMAASRAHLRHTLQRILMRQLLQGWASTAAEGVRLKSATVYGWKEVMHWRRQKPGLLAAAAACHAHRQAVGQACCKLEYS